ncbi:MAG: DNA polymerase III subunit epsilon [Candidatus Thioglobus sp.]|jgi:DNA polymerase-3 subunit epsilon|uniref:DNA polymerase III subunit epsilon n=1 Tax=Candidatus Thioglobus sp. TaxID=2026721 RepID=UPI001E127460|nr:DNA polymerase III subunit epsilon [Candidatus Thioglobus sp.]MBT3186215.1 DNA polymerase III subunit epsilon [Candidatus Thioglobus sp.]MBT3431360.1 DNA polymerase III subunit epsilon [Candidatus Thioglobus sp.]MBT4316355.1 DNA polymerase III subunit epsilon [Candidatus Thioglobus sp.]MBT4923551.1 DNA polymerase III subunit epsilon [Candidatus Thioglobus sp.]MBT6655358.1 DNA polymerase III subunit epsilon [Candidatus Thioglobus sp.]
MERLIVLDTETTGIEPSEGHRVIEIGCVEILNRAITDSQYQQYIQPNRNVGDSFRIHGISDNFLKDKPKFEEIAQEFLEYIEGSTLVIHNAPFDLGFLNHELKRLGSDEKIEDKCKIIDSLELSQKQRPGTMHNLDALCRRFDIDSSSRTVHGALLDAQILAQVYLAMTGGQFTLFSDTEQSEDKKNNENNIVRIDASHSQVKVIQANKAELEAHNTYFENV